MPSSTSFLDSDRHERSSTVALLLAAIAAPLGWLIALEAGYVASYARCTDGSPAVLHVALLLPLIVPLASGLIAWRAKSKMPSSSGRLRVSDSTACWAAWLSASAVLLILVTYLPVWFLAPCQ
jgi:hypothetical protein